MIYLFIVLALLQVADTYTTVTILSKGGVERNPIMKKIFQYVTPVYALSILKGIFLIVLFVTNGYQSGYLMLIAIMLYVGIVINNVLVINKL